MVYEGDHRHSTTAPIHVPFNSFPFVARLGIVSAAGGSFAVTGGSPHLVSNYEHSVPVSPIVRGRRALPPGHGHTAAACATARSAPVAGLLFRPLRALRPIL